MKYMKLGYKTEAFHSEEDNIRYVATELATDVTINVGDVKFYLHKFPLLSKSSLMQKLVAASGADEAESIDISDIPGGPAAFEICAKFCYGITVTLNANNVVPVRCAAEYLEMYDTVEKGNLIYKIEVFLNSCIFRSWKDSIIVLQQTRWFSFMAEELKIISRCLDSIAAKACIDTSKVEWSYSYNWMKLPAENVKDQYWNGARNGQFVPKDWWVEDLCDLHLDLYKRVISTIKLNGNVAPELVGKALIAYTRRRIPCLFKDDIQVNDGGKSRRVVEMVVSLLPLEMGSLPCEFMFKLLKAAILFECEDAVKFLVRRISQQLNEATVSDLLIRAAPEVETMYDLDIVEHLLKEFIENEPNSSGSTFQNEERGNGVQSFRSDSSKALVAKLIDAYLTEISKDPNLSVSKFLHLAEGVSNFPRVSHDGIYRAIDTFLKEHAGIGKAERKRICKLMDCRKLSVEACAHAIQNDRLPLRVVVQVLFFEQVRQASSSGTNSPELSGPLKALLPDASYGSSRTTTSNTEEDWDSVPTAEDVKALKGEFAAVRLNGDGSIKKMNSSVDTEKAAAAVKMKGIIGSKILSKLWSKSKSGDLSSSDTSSPGSLAADETRPTTFKSGRQSVS